MRDFYERFYAVVAESDAHAAFCERVFGKNLCQHGFADIAQIEAIMECLDLTTDDHALDLGCGNGMIAEYIAGRSGARVTGLDIVVDAVRQAQARTETKPSLAFAVADINDLGLSCGAFDDVISIDSLYFSRDLPATIGQLKRALRSGGQMAIFYSHGREPWVPVADFPLDTLDIDKTPLAQALQAHGLSYDTRDFTSEDLRLAELRTKVLCDLKPQFDAEGITFIYENRMGDAVGISEAIAAGMHRRYLYHVRV